jgi:uncharacterized protein YbjT (DUF2867 family)
VSDVSKTKMTRETPTIDLGERAAASGDKEAAQEVVVMLLQDKRSSCEGGTSALGQAASGESHPFPMVATRDIGETAADALLGPPSVTQWIELSGPREYSFVDAAEAASRILGRTARATPMPLEALVPALTQFGLTFPSPSIGRWR